MQIVSKLKDRRVNCHSILTTVSVRDFLNLVGLVYEKRGGIEGQRAPLKTKTGLSIRARMVEDLMAGAVVPPVVVGIHAKSDETQALSEECDGDRLLAVVRDMDPNQISIIDGMQRTTALLEARRNEPRVEDEMLRVEFWVSESLNSLIYRMLVLNTGQVPWEVSRQLETVYSQLLTIVRREVGDHVDVFSRDDLRRRSEAGQYQASSIIRLFLAFSSRRAEIDLKDRVAEDFARLDAIEASSHDDFLTLFIRTMNLLVVLDKLFSRSAHVPKSGSVRISDGQELFQSFPALVGFFVAVALKVFDDPGFEVNWGTVEDKMRGVEVAVEHIQNKLNDADAGQIKEFLELDLLNDRLAQRSGQVGRFERDLFVRAFRSMIDNAHRLKDMTPCWRA